MAGWAQAVFVAWVGLGLGASVAAPEGSAPPGQKASLSKPEHQAKAWDGAGELSWSRRAWGEAPNWCEVSMVPEAGSQTNLVREGRVGQDAMELFLLAHEMGHCADRRAPSERWREPEQDIRREVFADAFAGCAMAQSGKWNAANAIADERWDDTRPGARSRAVRERSQQRAIRLGVGDPSCVAGSGFDVAARAARKAEQEILGSAPPMLASQ